MDGRGVIAALALGAEAAQLGTRFLLARESGATPAYRRRLLDADETDTAVTDAYTGRPARGIRNRFLDRMAERRRSSRAREFASRPGNRLPPRSCAS